jgi:hypothetical protein
VHFEFVVEQDLELDLIRMLENQRSIGGTLLLREALGLVGMPRLLLNYFGEFPVFVVNYLDFWWGRKVRCMVRGEYHMPGPMLSSIPC